MGTDHEVQEAIGKALAEAGVQVPGGDVGRVGSLDDLARSIMDALADEGYRLVKRP